MASDHLTADQLQAEAVLIVLRGNPLKRLGYHDRQMIRGRALARLKRTHRDEYEAWCLVEAQALVDSGTVRPW